MACFDGLNQSNLPPGLVCSVDSSHLELMARYLNAVPLEEFKNIGEPVVMSCFWAVVGLGFLFLEI